MHDIAPSNTVLSVRKFNRFYTREFGFLRRHMLRSDYSLVECRIIYELAQTSGLAAKDLTTSLSLDPGYLSRTLKKLEDAGLVTRERSPHDGRSMILTLTDAGRAEAKSLADMANEDVAARLEDVDEDTQRSLIASMKHIEAVLGEGTSPLKTAVIRTHRPGDLGWVVQAHGEIYSTEYAFNAQFEALVARIVTDFLECYDASCERCWIAEIDGERVGSIVLVREADGVARLRLFLLTKAARGLGLGQRMIGECLAFAQSVGYKKVVLSTNSVLHTARRIYEKAGFTLVGEEATNQYGEGHILQDWELTLRD
ncbi:bifunctional helix-turn-helix transcriptional regulator/GNAT family N-acetyltransferase [Kordiimonas gwangyangensis]|uniref:bifunctional helix-turn-helix transcriptional regulator/GNAT family N-acetyltransferase n=1 Tax=Kordiimonas gwangyangensis TaxID=288022 RepID=UPI00037401B0|nr:bifunctional helix-turn-helix transcriptional regulator/GNAT family N-acetyltransferase [Kordiimonas gwangyangensis]